MSTIDKLIRRQIKLTILSVIAVVLITSTITYALYQTNHENTVDQTISIGNLGLTATGTPITLEGLYPMEEYDLTSSYPRYEFTLENKTNGVNNDYTLMYELVLRVDESTTLNQDDYQYIMYKIDGSAAKPLSEVWDSEINGFKILDGRLLSNAEATGTFAGKDKENHSVVFWLSTYAPNSMQGKVLTLKMSLEAYADRFNYLKYQTYINNLWDSTLTSDNILGKIIDRSLFENINFLNNKFIPSNAIESWDVSQKQNKSIMAWYTDSNDNGLYELYIGQNGGVIANPNSSALFVAFTNVKYINGLNNLETKYVTNMNVMFKNMRNLKELDINHFNISNVGSIYNMFTYCENIETLDLSNWDTHNFNSSALVGTFWCCYHLKNLNIENFDISNVTSMQSMFNGCMQIVEINMRNVHINRNINAPYMFHVINGNAKIITNECSEEFIRARLADANRSNVTLEVVPCVKVCYSNNINNLPSEYTELSYIESTGTQYIDSGYKPTPNTGIYADFQFNDLTTTTNPKLFGTLIQTNNPLYYTFYIYSSSNKWGYSNLNTSLINSNIAADLKRHVLEYNIQNKKVLLDSGATIDSTLTGTQTQSSISNLTIMAGSTENTINRFSKLKLYSFKIYENGALVRNYIPALRKSDNVIGLYETEEGRFYTNSGTGVFNSNGGMQIKTGNTIQLARSIDARPGYTFVGWNTKPDGTGTTFKQGEVVDVSVLKSLGEDTVILYAMWEEN